MPEGYQVSQPEFVYSPSVMVVQPPLTIDVRDRHKGFTAETTPGNTLWRPGNVLKKTSIGTLQSYKTNSFYQNNDNVTQAKYKVPGYPYPVILWFDNETKLRIA